MPVETLSAFPDTIESGSLVRFTTGDSDFPNDAWTLAFALNNGAVAPLVVAGTVSGTGFVVVLTAAQTAALAPGSYIWAEIWTNIATATEKVTGHVGTVEVLPNLGVIATPTFAQAQVTLLKLVLAEFNATTRSSVSFNGHSFSRASVSDYRSQLTHWEARVIAEQERTDRLRGNPRDRSIGIVFRTP